MKTIKNMTIEQITKLESALDKFANTVLITTLIGLLSIIAVFVMPINTAEAANVVKASNDSELVNALNTGADVINVENMNLQYSKGIVGTYRNRDDVNRCLSRNSSVSKNKNNIVIQIRPSYDCDRSEIAARNNTYWNTVRSIAGAATGSQYKKADYVYTQLLNRVSYDWGSTTDKVDRYFKHCTATSALIDGSSICAGYSLALVDLFKAVGINAWVVETPDHAWVECVIDGYTLTCDPTNDDKENTRDWFLIKKDGYLYRPEPVSTPVDTANIQPSAIRDDNELTAYTIENGNIGEDPVGISGADINKTTKRVPICAVKVQQLKGYFAPANDTIYSGLTEAKYSLLEPVNGLVLYHTIETEEIINGKPVIDLA